MLRNRSVAPMQRDADVAYGDAERAGDLVVAKPIEMAKAVGFALLLREIGQCFAKMLGEFRGLHCSKWTDFFRPHLAQLRRTGQIFRLTTAAAQMIERRAVARC